MKERNFDWKNIHWLVGHVWGITHPDSKNTWHDVDSVEIADDGAMEFTVKYNPKTFDGVTKDYSVGLVTSLDEFTYGTYTWKCEMPEGTNLWPSLWVSGYNSWPPEIDMVEGYTYRGNDDYIRNIFESYLECNIHYKTTTSEHEHIRAIGVPTLIFKLLGKKINTYKFKWTDKYVKFYFNGFKFRTVRKKEVIDGLNSHPRMRIKMNLMVNEKFDAMDYISCKPVMRVYDFKYEKI